MKEISKHEGIALLLIRDRLDGIASWFPCLIMPGGPRGKVLEAAEALEGVARQIREVCKA